MEIDLGLNDLDALAIDLEDSNFSGGNSSSSFGPGIELLMNDSKRKASQSVNVDLGDLDNMENELNDLSKSVGGAKPSGETASSGGGFSGFTSNLFNFGSSSANDKNDSKLGQATKDTTGTTKTWDGFTKINDIPSETFSASANMTDREKRRKKKIMIKKLEEWYEKGQIKNITHFNNDSDYQEVEDEYESFLEEKRRKDSIKLQGWWFMTAINSIEYANAAFDPFGINLDGWGEQISEDIDSYDEIFSELYDKYKGGKMAPELSLLLRLGFSAAVVNFTNKALSTATPGFNDVIRQSPELMKMFTNATVSSMSQQSPGFAFANNIAGGNRSEPVNTSFGPPPAPVETKNMSAPTRPGMNFNDLPGNRQDINAARGSMFREKGVDMSNSYSDPNKQEKTIRTPSQFNPSSVDANSTQRPEMRGPQNSDINNLLSGLKTRTINIHESPSVSAPSTKQINLSEDDSLISIASLKDMQGTNMPKRVNRGRNRSDKNTSSISLDI